MGEFESVDVQAISDFIARLQEQLPQLPLDAEEYGIIEAQMATIESQFSSPYPQPALLREPLASIESILAEATEEDDQAATFATRANQLLQQFTA